MYSLILEKYLPSLVGLGLLIVGFLVLLAEIVPHLSSFSEGLLVRDSFLLLQLGAHLAVEVDVGADGARGLHDIVLLRLLLALLLVTLFYIKLSRGHLLSSLEDLDLERDFEALEALFLPGLAALPPLAAEDLPAGA